MLKSQIKVGSTYLMNHSSGRIKVRIRREIVRLGTTNRRMNHWEALNLKTGRSIEVKSAAKLLMEIVPRPAVEGTPRAE